MAETWVFSPTVCESQLWKAGRNGVSIEGWCLECVVEGGLLRLEQLQLLLQGDTCCCHPTHISFLCIWRDSATRFLKLGFFHESVSPKPLSILLVFFQIFSKICDDIHSSRCTSSLVDTGGKCKTSLIRKVLFILFGHLWVVESVNI
jgi:hypothetical protein